MAAQLHDAIKFTNFDVLPHGTILENNDKNIVIKMIYKNNSQIPYIVIGPALSLRFDIFRLDFMYFQWFDEKSSSSIPIELHVIFRNRIFETLQEALDTQIKKHVIIMAFGLQVKFNNIYDKYRYMSLV